MAKARSPTDAIEHPRLGCRLRSREAKQRRVFLRASPPLTALLLLLGLNLVNYMDRYVLPGVQSLIQGEFKVSDEQMGSLTTAFFLTYMLAAPLMGWMGDHFPRKPLIVGSAILWSVLTLLTARVHTYETLFWRHAAVGIGEATFCIFAPAFLAAARRSRRLIIALQNSVGSAEQ